jgi:hypothetical protein
MIRSLTPLVLVVGLCGSDHTFSRDAANRRMTAGPITSPRLLKRGRKHRATERTRGPLANLKALAYPRS